MLTLEEWLNMTDNDLRDLIAKNEGYEIDNPFDKSIDRWMNREDPESKWEIIELPDELTPEQIKNIQGEVQRNKKADDQEEA